MVQFNLPENSKILKGEYYKDKTNSKNIKLEILKILGNELQKRGFRLRKETGGTITWH